MDNEKIIKDNKLIAEFMGYTIKPSKNIMYDSEQAWLTDGKTYYKTNELRFHLSWDWLMDVVEKIEKMGYSFISAPFWDDEENKISGEYFCIIQHRVPDINQPYFIDVVNCSSKKEAVFKAVIEFIKRYNENKLN